MGILLLVIAGIIMFAITLFIHRHTYHKYSDEPLSLPRWVYWTALLIALIPVLNVAVFIFGVVSYLTEDEIYFKNNSKWWVKLSEFLSKDV